MCIFLIFLLFVQAQNVDVYPKLVPAGSPQVLGAKAAQPPDNVESMIFLGRDDDASVSVLRPKDLDPWTCSMINLTYLGVD